MTPRFFPYRPTRLRAILAAFAVIGLAFGTALLARPARGSLLASARGAAGLALGCGFLWLAWRLRPRDGYGVRVDLAGTEVARPLDGRLERLLWQHIGGVSQTGRWAPRWVLTLTDGTRRELPRALFSDPAVFADLGHALSGAAASIPRDA